MQIGLYAHRTSGRYRLISILAAILFPVFGRARENARRSSCLNNAKQMGLGIMQYTQDFDERYPPARETSAAAGRRNWAQMIYPYIKNESVYRCPSNAEANRKFDAGTSMSYTGSAPYQPARMPPSYSYNYHFGQDFANTIPLAAVEKPSQKIIVAEMDSSIDAGMAYRYWNNGSVTNEFRDRGFAGHLQTWNCIFADGHSKSYRPASTATPFNMWGMFEGGRSEPAVKAQPNCDTGNSINCDAAPQTIITDLKNLEAKH